MKTSKLIIPLLTIFSVSSYAVESAPQVQDLNINVVMANNNIQLTAKSTYPEDVMITKISEFTNNGDACASSGSDYIVHPKQEQPMFPFTYKDLSNCFSNVHLFKRYSNGSFPAVLGFYDSSKVYQLGDYLTDWGAFIITPIVFKVHYTYKNTDNVKGVVKYLVYKINE